MSLCAAPTIALLVDNLIPLYLEHLAELGYIEGKHYQIKFGPTPTLEYSWGHRVIFRSLGPISTRKLVGYTLSHASIDEAGQCAENTPIEVSKRVRCHRALVRQIIYYGTPEGVGNFFFRKFGSQAVTRIEGTQFSVGKNGRCFVLHGRTEDNPVVTQDYLETLRAELSWNKNLILAYMFGEFVPLYDHSAYDFDPARQKQDGPTWNDRPVYLCWDFNVTQGRAKGVSWTAQQEDGPDVHVVAENRGSSRTTYEAVDNFMTQFPKREWWDKEIVVTGDANGHSRDTRGYGNDYDIVIQKLRESGYSSAYIKAPRANPSQALRIASVNRLCSPNWHQRLLVRPKCSKTIDSLLQTTIGSNGQIIKSSGETHTDYADTVGYGAVLLRPIKLRPDSSGVDFNWA